MDHRAWIWPGSMSPSGQLQPALKTAEALRADITVGYRIEGSISSSREDKERYLPCNNTVTLSISLLLVAQFGLFILFMNAASSFMSKLAPKFPFLVLIWYRGFADHLKSLGSVLSFWFSVLPRVCMNLLISNLSVWYRPSGQTSIQIPYRTTPPRTLSHRITPHQHNTHQGQKIKLVN